MFVSEGLEITVRDSADRSQTVHRYRRAPIRIGRSELNDLHLQSGFVSQFHAVIEVVDDQIILRDLGSTNGSIVSGARISGEAVQLGQDKGVFAIMGLLLEVSKISISQVSPPKSKGAMNVTGLLRQPPDDLLRALEQARNASKEDPNREKLNGLYTNYRKTWDELRVAMQQSAMSLPAAERGAFFTQLSAQFPGVTGEADFHRMAESAGARSLMMRDPESEKAIALEGLKELFSEYVKDQVQPESADQIVAFLTRIRAVLDVFFKAYLPLRDGQRQFERDLAISGSGAKLHPVEQVDTPRRLSSVLLSLEQGDEDSAAVVEGTLADIMIHHIAMLNGVMRGARNILNEISPQAVQEYCEQLISRGTLSRGFVGAHKALWQAFEKRHGDLVGEEKQLFSLLFGRQFSQAYQEATVSPTDPGVRKTIPS